MHVGLATKPHSSPVLLPLCRTRAAWAVSCYHHDTIVGFDRDSTLDRKRAPDTASPLIGAVIRPAATPGAGSSSNWAPVLRESGGAEHRLEQPNHPGRPDRRGRPDLGRACRAWWRSRGRVGQRTCCARGSCHSSAGHQGSGRGWPPDRGRRPCRNQAGTLRG